MVWYFSTIPIQYLVQLGVAIAMATYNFAFDLYREKIKLSGPHFRLPRFDSPLTTPSEVKINDSGILPIINYYLKKALFVKCLSPNLYSVI